MRNINFIVWFIVYYIFFYLILYLVFRIPFFYALNLPNNTLTSALAVAIWVIKLFVPIYLSYRCSLVKTASFTGFFETIKQVFLEFYGYLKLLFSRG